MFVLGSYKNFINTMLYRRLSITLEEIKVALNSKELKKRMMKGLSGIVEGLIVRGKS